MGACRLKNLLWNLYQKWNVINKDSLFFFFFCLQNVSKSLDYQYNAILLIKIIKESKKKKKKRKRIKRKSHFFLNRFSVDQIDIFSELLWVLLVTKQENATKTIIRHLLFNNFPCLTYPAEVSLINNLIFMLKYSILVLEQDGWMFTQ